ncbi:hypothetical protein CDD80_6543 [Ophiocordyceps camponoti-rufipedis]|uniref:SCP domain-containing protein n=1 Tax=Ophiocordyceps camponoti-rufipedis TaxID=2004952 RepID=A0A2C5ZHH0_9HYPO|nr:hypothetical protein CDD80_6543 [Ophiocordyceps camponoti-rufipedis]
MRTPVPYLLAALMAKTATCTNAPIIGCTVEQAMWEVYLETGMMQLNGTYQQVKRQLQELRLAEPTEKPLDQQDYMKLTHLAKDTKPSYVPNPSCGPWQKARSTSALKAISDIHDLEDHIVPLADVRGQECVRYSCVEDASVWLCNTNPSTSAPRGFLWRFLPQKAMQIFNVCSWPGEPGITGRIDEVSGMNAGFTTAVLRQKCET